MATFFLVAHIAGTFVLIIFLIWAFRALRMDLTILACQRRGESMSIVAISLTATLVLLALLVNSCIKIYYRYILS